MPTNTNQQTMTRWITEMWGGGDLSLVDQFTSADYVYRAPGQDDVQGAKALKDLVTFYRTVFPDLSNVIAEQIVAGDTVVTRGTTRGTHKAPLGNVPASGRAVAVAFVLISKFKNGKIAEEWEIFDSLGLMQQIGAIPAGH